MKYVPFDPDWFAIGYLEPEFVEEITGWHYQELLFDRDDLEAVWQLGSDTPVQFLATRKVDLDEPRPIKQISLKWRWTG